MTWWSGCRIADRMCEELGNPVKCTESMNIRARKQSIITI
nr:MAG TPA: hypothetical protein [Caudoviricetes sp.]